MLRHAFMAVLIALLTSQVLLGEDVTPEETVKRWCETLTQNKADLISAFYEQSEQVEIISSSGKLKQGFGAVKNEYVEANKLVNFFESKASAIQTRTIGECAYVTFRHDFKFKVLSNQSNWHRTVRTTMLMAKADGKWLILNEHSSPIFGVEFTKETDRLEKPVK